MRRALAVGIDQYSFGPLRGCVGDVEKICSVLAKHEDEAPNFECRKLIAPIGGPNDMVTRSKLRQAIEQLFRDKAEVALLHFSGHGTENNLGGYLVTQDAERYDDGVPMTDVLQLANESRADEVIVLLDCCHSGSMGQIPAISNDKALLREGVCILTASRGDQPSVESNGSGLFTSLVTDALNGGAADLLGNVTASSIYATVEAALGAWSQRPLFKAHISRMLPIRRCRPPIPTAYLRKLPTLFPVPAEDLALSPEFERTMAEAKPELVEQFTILQALNKVYLVTPVGADHMFDAAVGSKYCRLTAAGRYYWRLAFENHV